MIPTPNHGDTDFITVYLFISDKQHNHKKYCPFIRCMFWPIDILLSAGSPTHRWYFLSIYVHDWDHNTKGLSRAPFLFRSKEHYPVLRKSLTACCDYSSCVRWIRIQPMTSAIKSVLSKVGLLGSNIVKTGEDVTTF